MEELVLARAFRDVGLVRWMVEVAASVAYITDAIGLEELRARGSTARLVGFPKEDIFQPDDRYKAGGEAPDWKTLTPWF